MELKNQIAKNPEIEDITPFLRCESIEIKTQADLELAASYLKEIDSRLKNAKRWHDDVVGPIKKGVAAFELRLRTSVTDPLNRIRNIVKNKIQVHWDSQQALKEAEERKKREAEIEAAKQLADENLDKAMLTGSEVAKEAALNFEKHAVRLEAAQIEVRQTIHTTGATVAQMRIWRWKIVDFNKIPKEYLVLDESKLNALARGYSKQQVNVDGIEFYQESRALVR